VYNNDDDDLITCSPTRICNIYSGLDERRISTGVASPLGKDTSLYLTNFTQFCAKRIQEYQGDNLLHGQEVLSITSLSHLFDKNSVKFSELFLQNGLIRLLYIHISSVPDP
jgi:hypothetical protein